MLLMTEIPNKVKLWQNACYQILEERPDIGYLLQDKAYLDSLERGQAIVGVKTWNLLEMLERKRVVPLLEKVFTEIIGKPVQVKLTHGRPRIIERKPKPMPQQCSECGKSPSHCVCEYGPLAPKQAVSANAIPWANPELGALHAQYGDIMGIVDNHPVFVQATKTLTKGGWGIFNKELTNLCKDYGADIVLKGLRNVANRPRAERPRAYFFKNLKAGVYGHKLAIGASVIGPVRTSS
jgi:hypothetical protein